MIKVLFMGTPDYASEILKTLIEDKDIEVQGVFTQPDKPVGRKKVLTPPPVKVLALEHKIPCYQPISLKDDQVINKIYDIDCDFIIVAAYGQLLPRRILEYVPCINLHASILPKYRGASPIQQAILEGDSITGVSAMLMDEGLDTGDILKIIECPILPNEMAYELYKKLTKIASDLTIDVLKNFEKYPPKPQDDKKATYCKKITKLDGMVSFDNATKVFNRYRAFTPWPGIFLESGLKLKKIAIETVDGNNNEGEILSIEKDFITVGCKQGSLKIFKVQSPSKKEVDIISYINGKRLEIGNFIS